MIKQLIVFLILIGIASAGTYQIGDTYIKGTLNTKNATTLNDTTIAASKTLAITTADKLTEAGIIIPQKKDFPYRLTATSENNTIFIADQACVITSIRSEVETVGTYSAGNVSCKILKLTGTNLATTTSPGPMSCLASGQAINLKDTPGTVRSNTLNATAGSITLAAGDRLGIKFNNQLTGLTGCITITMKRV